MQIRAATHSDAEVGSRLLRCSIEDLCHADHGGDRQIIDRWISNKTPDAWRTWVDQVNSKLYVAVEGGRLLGVGMMDAGGEIMLNYVSPDARLRGVSKALLWHMEAEASRCGLNECSLDSTKTARRFYESAGYRCQDTAGGGFHRMTKRLVT